MDDDVLDDTVRNVDIRLNRMKHCLPALATRDDLYAAIRADGKRSRDHATALFEILRNDSRLILEHLLALSARVDAPARR